MMKVKASSFADPADVRRFHACKAEGKTDQQCFKVGDNGIGTPQLGSHVTAQKHTAMCALPPDDMIARWGSVVATRGKRVVVKHKLRSVSCLVADRMPWKKNIMNGAGIDLNPAASAALGLKPPHMVDGVEWEWEVPAGQA